MDELKEKIADILMVMEWERSRDNWDLLDRNKIVSKYQEKADQILALFDKAGYLSPEELKEEGWIFPESAGKIKEHIAHRTGQLTSAEQRNRDEGWVKLSKDQILPDLDTSRLHIYDRRSMAMGMSLMLKAGFKKVEE